jgi:hypothetical protein
MSKPVPRGKSRRILSSSCSVKPSLQHSSYGLSSH